MSTPEWFPWAVIGLLGACFVLLLVLLLSQGLERKRIGRMLRSLSEHLVRDLESLEDEQENQHSRLREEITGNLHAMYDSLVNTFTGISRNWGEQMREGNRQNYEMGRGLEERQQAFQHQVQENLSALRETLDNRLAAMNRDQSARLEEMRRTVDEKLDETLEKRLNASFSRMGERLDQVYRTIGEMNSLAGGVNDLKKLLGNVKTRGVWGEIQLQGLLEQALTEGQYRANVEVVPGSRERVEFAVCLPGREPGDAPLFLPIDSKFPQEDYLRLSEASLNGDAQALAEAQKALLAAVRTEAKRIGKYIAPPHSTDFAVMFLPLESLYAEVMCHSAEVESIQREQHVLIAGPSTLLALLNSLQMGFRTLAIEKRSAEVWKLLGAVKGDFHTFGHLLQKTQEKLQQATDSIDTAFVRTRSIEKRLRDVETLEEAEAGRLLEINAEKDGLAQ